MADAVKVAFKRGSGANDLVDRVICWWTKSWACHAEVAVPGFGWVSAHQQTGKVDAVQELGGSPDLWRFVEVPYLVTEAATSFVEETLDASYDYLSIFDFILHDRLTVAGKEICSRFVRDFLDHCDWAGEGKRPVLPANPSPGDLVRVFLPGIVEAEQGDIQVSAEDLAQFAKLCAESGRNVVVLDKVAK